MLQRIQVLRAALGELERNALTDQTQRAAVREAHKLAGSLGTYGLMRGSEVAREIEVRLEAGPLDPSQASWLRDRVVAMDQILHKAAYSAKTGSSGADEGGQTHKAIEAGAAVIPGKARSGSEGDDGAQSVQAEHGSDGVSTSQTGPGPDGQKRSIEDPLGRLLRALLGELENLEPMVADMVRGVDQRAHAVGRKSHSGMGSTHPGLLQAKQVVESVASRLERLGLDAPALRARLLAERFTPPVMTAAVAKIAEGLLELNRNVLQLHRQATSWDSRDSVWVVSADDRWRDEVGAALQVAGMRVRLLGRPDAPHDPKKELQKDPQGDSLETPQGGASGIIVDAHPQDGTDMGLTGDWEQWLRRLPAIVAFGSPRIEDRVRAGDMGADRVLDREVAPHGFASTLRELLKARESNVGRVLVVDDDETVLDAVESTLTFAGFEVATVQGTGAFWESLEQWSPQLVITDLDMPGLDGADLCTALRTDPRWENLPVVFLSSKDDAATLRRVFEAGADDYVHKPLDPLMLLARVRSRLARQSSRLATGHLDPVTRLPMGPSFEGACEGLVQAAGKGRRTVTMCVLRLDHALRLRKELGHVVMEREEARLARVLTGRCPAQALLGRRDMDRFIVALDGVDTHDAKALLEEVIAQFDDGGPSTDAPGVSHRLTVSGGVAQLGDHGDRLAELMNQAESARQDAEAAGGSRVFMAGTNGEEGRLQKVDVLVVDDDPTIGELLLETLGEDGWRVHWESDSERALDRLSSSSRDLVARAILLDVNMPNMDGLTMLRLLSERGVVPPARVIMLTVRAREDEVVQALKLGAVDHVAKPFSVPVLASRLKKSLGDPSG